MLEVVFLETVFLDFWVTVDFLVVDLTVELVDTFVFLDTVLEEVFFDLYYRNGGLE